MLSTSCQLTAVEESAVSFGSLPATLRGPVHAPLYLETLAELPCCTFYDARGGEVLARTAGTFYGGAVTHL